MGILNKLFTLMKSIDAITYKSNNKTAKWSGIRQSEAMELEEKNVDLKKVTIYYKNGTIVNVIPDVYSYYKAQYYVIDGVKYDSYNIDSIKKIPVPNYCSSCDGTPVYNLEYIIKMRAGQERREGHNDLAYALFSKSLEIMKVSNVLYNKKDFMPIINWLYEDGNFDEADKLLEKIRKDNPSVFDDKFRSQELVKRVLNTCKDLDCDYIISSSHHCTCAECAKLQNRVFCISGKDKRFPKLPETVLINGGFHDGCRHDFHPFFIEADIMLHDKNGKEQDTIKYSNRPFIDDRTESEKESYEQYQKEAAHAEFVERTKRSYYVLKHKYPELMPKSYSAFSRIRNANTARYQEIKRIADNENLEI